MGIPEIYLLSNNSNIKSFLLDFFALLTQNVGVFGALEGALGNLINATASLGNVTGGFGAQLMAIASMHPVITTIVGITAAIGGTIFAIDHFTESLSEAQDKAEKSKGNYDSITSEIESMNSELDSTRQRIAEINAQENISITDAEELGRLREQNEYLQRQIELRETLIAIEKSEEARQVVSDIKDYI